MAAPSQGSRVTTDGLLPAALGHVARGTAPGGALVASDAIEPFLSRVAESYRASLATGSEHGFLAYAPDRAGLPLVAEASASGGRDHIRWHWERRHATVAFSFHTHPGRDALCIPSGIDMVGALIRGDHLVYVLTSRDGRLTGWRFREPSRHPRAVDEAMRALESARGFNGRILAFLYEAFDAMRPRLMEPVYAARVRLLPGDDCMLERAAPDDAFFCGEERTRGRP